MNASSSLPPSPKPEKPFCQRFYRLLPLAALLTFGLASLPAQDSVTLKNGQRREGKITGVSNNTIRIAISAQGAGTVESSVPLAEVQTVSMEAPADFAKARTAWQNGQAAETVKFLTPLVNGFLGLPANWVKQAAVLLVDAQLAAGDDAAAEKGLADFNKAYPDATDLTPLLRAKLAIQRKNFVGAKPLLAPIVEEGSKTKLADSSQSVLYGQAFYMMGLIHEQEGNLSEALQDYLRTTTLFFEDAATAAKARERADFLMNEKNVVVP
jgi:hypothetical protein